jgi:hypothetical protein
MKLRRKIVVATRADDTLAQLLAEEEQLARLRADGQEQATRIREDAKRLSQAIAGSGQAELASDLTKLDERLRGEENEAVTRLRAAAQSEVARYDGVRDEQLRDLASFTVECLLSGGPAP